MAKNKPVDGSAEEENLDGGTDPGPEPKVPAGTKKGAEPDIAELVSTINALVGLVKDGQQRDEETRQRLATMENKHAEEMEKVLEVIESTGDKSRVTNFQLRNAKKQPSEYGVCTYDGKIVVSWGKMKSNLVYKNELKATVENLVSTLTYENGSSEDVPYQKWQLERIMLPAQFAGKEVKIDEQTGEEINLIKLTVLPSDVAKRLNIEAGKPLSINVIFLN